MQTYRNYTPDYGRRQNYSTNRSDYRGNMNRQGYGRIEERTPESSSSCSCGCERRNDPLNGMALAMAYVPWQTWECPYDSDKALCRGTIFESLDKPFLPKGGMIR